jgi:hypothetical protein
MGFASGKHAKFISDRSGFAFPYSERVREWNGAIVHISEFEAKHPQLEPTRDLSDDIALRDARSDRTEPGSERILTQDPFTSGSSGSAVITLKEVGHGRVSGDKVRFRKVTGFDGFSSSTLEKSSGYSITVTDADTYTFTASSGTATTGGQRGGGKNATVGSELAGVAATISAVFTLTVSASVVTSTTTFDSSSITLDSSTKTFDEG